MFFKFIAKASLQQDLQFLSASAASGHLPSVLACTHSALQSKEQSELASLATSSDLLTRLAGQGLVNEFHTVRKS